MTVDIRANEHHAAARAGQTFFEKKKKRGGFASKSGAANGANKPNFGPKYNYNEDYGTLVVQLFDACAELYSAVTQDSLRVQNQELNQLTEQEQRLSDAINAEGEKIKKAETNKDSKSTIQGYQNMLTDLQDQLKQTSTRVQKANTTISTTISAASTMVAILGKLVAASKQGIDSITPNM